MMRWISRLLFCFVFWQGHLIANQQPWADFWQHVGVIRSQLKELQSDHLAQAYAYTSRDFRKATSMEQFRRFVEAHPVLERYKSITFDNMFFQNDMTVFQGTLLDVDGKKYGVEFDLIEEYGKWKVFGIKVAKST